jgi:DNA-binding transcriptional regulator of glucitol operon
MILTKITIAILIIAFITACLLTRRDIKRNKKEGRFNFPGDPENKTL